MATSPALISLEEYLRTSYHPDADYVDGEIEERNLGEYEHARLQYVLAGIFGKNEREWNVRGLTVEKRFANESCALRRSSVSRFFRRKIAYPAPRLCYRII
jgi:Uma2 family endonuclease